MKQRARTAKGTSNDWQLSLQKMMKYFFYHEKMFYTIFIEGVILFSR